MGRPVLGIAVAPFRVHRGAVERLSEPLAAAGRAAHVVGVMAFFVFALLDGRPRATKAWQGGASRFVVTASVPYDLVDAHLADFLGFFLLSAFLFFFFFFLENEWMSWVWGWLEEAKTVSYVVMAIAGRWLGCLFELVWSWLKSWLCRILRVAEVLAILLTWLISRLYIKDRRSEVGGAKLKRCGRPGWCRSRRNLFL